MHTLVKYRIMAISSRPLLFVKVPVMEKNYGVQPHEMYKKQKKIAICKEFIKLYCFREDVSSSLKVLVKCILVSPILLSEVFHRNS